MALTIKYNALLTQDTRIQDYMNLKRKIEIEPRLGKLLI